MKAVIKTGGKQYIVEKGDELEVELLTDAKSLSFEPLMIIDDKDSKVGKPTITGAAVKAKLLENIRSDKVTVQKFQAKKRVHSKKGHRQNLSRIQITDITLKK